MSKQPDLDPQAIASANDFLSRRHLFAGAAVVAALGGATAEALAQGAPGGAPGNLRFLNPPTSFKNPGFNHAVEATGPGRILYIAGQQGRDIDNKIVGAPGDFRAQATQVFENLKTALAAAGAAFGDVVKGNYYVLDMSNIAVLREVRAKYVGAAPPASTLVEVKKLANDAFLVEIEVVAVCAK